jgi:hypothetical protein
MTNTTNATMKITKTSVGKSYSAGQFRLSTFKAKESNTIFTTMIFVHTPFSTYISRKEASLLLKKVRKESVK